MASETEKKIVDGAIRTFVRLGARKTSMADVAEAAGVSRQTVYDIFGNKDELIVASIRQVTEENLSNVRDRIARCRTLEERLNAYFDETVVKSFRLLQSSGDPEDLISGHNVAGKSAIEESHRHHEKVIADVLAPYEASITSHGESVAGLAHYLVTVVMSFKSTASDQRDLKNLLASLTAAVKAISQHD